MLTNYWSSNDRMLIDAFHDFDCGNITAEEFDAIYDEYMEAYYASEEAPADDEA